MAKAVVESFPLIPNVKFKTFKKDMKGERRDLALKILETSGSYAVNHAYSIHSIYYVNNYINNYI